MTHGIALLPLCAHREFIFPHASSVVNHTNFSSQLSSDINIPNMPQYALVPSLMGSNFIDYMTILGQKLFACASAPLTTPFDCKLENLQAFPDNIQTLPGVLVGLI